MKKSYCSIIIPNWNGLEFLKTCLSSLQKQTFKDFEIIVVDNGSDDGSIQYIEQNFPTIKLIKLPKNFGFARAINLGVQASVGQVVVLLNNDTEVDKNCLKYLIQAAKKHPEVGFVAAKMLQFKERNILDSAGDYIDVVGHANNIGMGEYDGPEFNRPGYIFLVTGGGSLFKDKVFKKVGFLDEDFFAYFEDVDFCLRAQMQGFKGWYEPKAIIYHIHKATAKRNPGFLQYLQFRNMMQTIIKDFPGKLLVRDFNWLRIILVNLNTVFYLTKWGFFWSALKAEWYIVTHIIPLLSKRAQIQRKRLVPDQYFIDNVKKKPITFFGLFSKGI